MDISTWLILTIVSLALSALFSGVEIAFVTSDRVRTELDVARGGLISKIINRFYANGEFFISSILVGNNIMLVIYGMGAAALLEPWLKTWIGSEALILLAQTIISTIVILFTGEFIPKTIFRINPNSSLKVFALPVFIFYLILYPISWFSTFLSRMLMRLVGIKSADTRMRVISVGELNEFIEENIDTMEEKHHEVENEVKIFQNALDFSHTHLRDCMTPRNEVVAVNISNTSREQLSQLFTTSGRSKIIVYRDDIDNILGYIHVSELFNPEADWRERVKPVLFAPENLLANKMMRRLLQQKKSLAVVVDEFGGTAGIISLEDLVEEIFGDIQDEHDKSRLTARMLAPDIYEFSGRCEIAAINEQFDLDIPENDDYQTIAGYILHTTGTIPAKGEHIDLGDLTFEITRTSASRIELVRVIRNHRPEE
ncbi:MAG: HlyC/CorC family transporter [Muribaculaceae bacterium]|nr:HlyC/CorC family transporter [Muribaculaceae bacterium]